MTPDFEITLKNYRCFSSENPITIKISKGITFVLGVNNCGKSTILKAFLELKPLFKLLAEDSTVKAIRGNSFGRDVAFDSRFDHIRHRNFTDLPTYISIECEASCITFGLHDPPAGNSPNNLKISATVSNNSIGEGEISKFCSIGKHLSNCLYIPTVRSLEVMYTAAQGGILLGSSLVEEWEKRALGEDILQKSKLKILEENLKKFFGYTNFSISAAPKRSTLQLYTDEGIFDIDELGNGISHFVIVMTNIAFKQPGFVLIDEPENGLHPKMQSAFVRALADNSSYGLLATSHSIGLAKSVAATAYSLTKYSNGKRHLGPFGQHTKRTLSQSLFEMGFSQISEIGGAHILLVEGRTDVKSYREILRKYEIDKDFIILQLGGSNMITEDVTQAVEELKEITRLNPNSVSVIFDSERPNKTERMAGRFLPFHDACLKLGFNVFPTEWHSTENYISQAAIDKILQNGTKALGRFERPDRWKKNLNWLMFVEMNKDEFKGTELDTFIREKLIPLTKETI